MESNKELPKITILDAMAMLKQSWSALPDIPVVNCFKKAGISEESQQDSIQDTNDSFVQLPEMLDELRALDPDLAHSSQRGAKYLLVLVLVSLTVSSS